MTCQAKIHLSLWQVMIDSVTSHVVYMAAEGGNYLPLISLVFALWEKESI